LGHGVITGAIVGHSRKIVEKTLCYVLVHSDCKFAKSPGLTPVFKDVLQKRKMK